MISDKSANIIIGVVTTVWAANALLAMVQWNGYHPSEAINGIFLTIVGGAFALRAKAKGDRDGSDRG